MHGPDIYVAPGEIIPVIAPFAVRLATGDSLVTVQAGIEVWGPSPAPDPNAAALVAGVPVISGTNGVVYCGGAFVSGASGFQPNAVYNLWVQATTANGATYDYDCNIVTQAATPPNFSYSTAPSSEWNETANFTPAAPGTYFIRASGLTLTVPAATVGGDIIVVDMTGAPNLTISGTILNAPAGLSPIVAANVSFRLRWSKLLAGFVILDL